MPGSLEAEGDQLHNIYMHGVGVVFSCRESDQLSLNIGTESQAIGVLATLNQAFVYYDKMSQY